MQKLINVIALLSGLVSLSVLGGGFYLYKNANVMIEDAREKVIQEIAEALPKIVEEMMPDVPEIPSATGGVIPPAPNVTGPAIPF
tara:strand:+ start:231 stop:485 length:255 start_codon:yes stop_codon:yes gene_type:complete